MRGGSETYIYSAVSGRPQNGKFDYSGEAQRQVRRGPIPEGTYWIKPDEMWENAWYKSGSRDSWGNYRITIHPFLTTETFGRGGFFIHGGAVPGSAGCIDLTSDMDRFVSDLRRELGGRETCQIHLFVVYPSPPGDYPVLTPRNAAYA
ncbi:MAG: DUF2778 domain-containing protein [Gammaproteobacteria bacterium]|nr:DUF2778 domain-containing protein [Gammaproteobacteria bacterium]